MRLSRRCGSQRKWFGQDVSVVRPMVKEVTPDLIGNVNRRMEVDMWDKCLKGCSTNGKRSNTWPNWDDAMWTDAWKYSCLNGERSNTWPSWDDIVWTDIWKYLKVDMWDNVPTKMFYAVGVKNVKMFDWDMWKIFVICSTYVMVKNVSCSGTCEKYGWKARVSFLHLHYHFSFLRNVSLIN